MILHIPHSGTDTLGYPIKIEDINRGTDWFTDSLFEHVSANKIIQRVSRFIVDCERLPDDIEPMFNDGYGIIYQKDFDGNDFPFEKDVEYLKGIYNEHHKNLNIATNKALCYFDHVFVVDCHSFGKEQKESGVDICFGHNSDFTEFTLLSKLINCCKDYNLTAGLNNPYSNAIVPSNHIGNKNVTSIMIEVNKRLYLTDEYNRNHNFDNIKHIINNLLDIISKKEDYYNGI